MNVYVGTFLIAFSTLALEITLSRFLSVSTWYHLAFFAISTAMLGMTAGATTVFLKKDWIERRGISDVVAIACLGYAAVLPVVLILLCMIPIGMERSIMPLFALLIITILCTLPFYFSGLALSTILTKYDLPIGKLYAVDLIGAALGCLFVLGGLEKFSASTLILICAFIGGISAFIFAFGSSNFGHRKALTLTCLGLLALIAINTLTTIGIYQTASKGEIVSVRDLMMEKWNSFSRVLVYKGVEETPLYWGPSPKLPKGESVLQYRMNIDGDAGTAVRPFKSFDDINNLRYDVTNIGYYLRPTGGACVIGVGGGRDLQGALLFGHQSVLGVELNPTFINLQKNEFREFAGLGNNEKVRLVADEARSYLTHSTEKFTVLQMSMIDTWAATGAGAFSLSENGLYTVEAWNIFYSRLNDDGIFTVSRWYNPGNAGEMGRMSSVAVTALQRNGVEDASKHIALITVGQISTLLMSKQPFSAQDVEKLRSVCDEMQFRIIAAPGMPPDDQMLRSIIYSKNSGELHAAIKDAILNYEPSTDESPYFFNMLKLDHLGFAFRTETGVVTGNLLATITLVGLIICLAVLAFITIILPLRIGTRAKQSDEGSKRIMRTGALYFCLIGAGFMFTEIAMIQKLSIFLGHPVYALGILLFTIIASTGLGSFFSDRLPLTRTPLKLVVPVLAAAIIVVERFALSELVARMITEPIMTKALLCIAVIFPLGILLGFFFPTGMKLFKPRVADDTPWFWALNGIFGVLSSAIAVFISIYFGITVNFYIAAFCYVLIVLPVYWVGDTVNEKASDSEVIPFEPNEPVAV
jgi:SAM-dependent methyltransferase